MNIGELRALYDRLRLADIIGTTALDGKWEMLIQSIFQCPVVREETHIVYQQLGAICTQLEKLNKSVRSGLSACTQQELVRAVEYVSATDPERLPDGIRELELTVVFADLAEAWNGADQIMSDRYMAIMTALQACYYLTVEKAPKLDAVLEQVLANMGREAEAPAAPAPAAPAPERLNVETPGTRTPFQLTDATTLEDLKSCPFGSEETLFDVYVKCLDDAIKALEDAQNYYDEIDPDQKKPYAYHTAIRFLAAVDDFNRNDALLSVPLKVNARDGSAEACKYRQVVPERANSNYRLNQMARKLESVDPDLRNKYQLYCRFSRVQEDLSTPVANKAQLLYLLPDHITYELVEDRADQLRELAEKSQYPYAYVLATKLYMLALGSREREAVETGGMYLSQWQCQREITESLAEYYHACYKKGRLAMDGCEAYIFSVLRGMYDTKYDYLQDVQKEVLTLAEKEDALDAAQYFLQLMDRYLPQRDAEYKKRQLLQKQYTKIQAIKPKMATFPAVCCFTGIFLLVNLVVTFLFMVVPSVMVNYFILLAGLSGLLYAQVRVMRVHPKAKVWMRIIPILGTALCAFVATFLYQPLCYFDNCWSGVVLSSEVGIPVLLMLCMPSIMLSFAPCKGLAAFPIYLRAYRLKQTVLFVLIYLLVAGLFFTLVCVGKGFFAVILSLAALVVMFMFSSGIGWAEDLVYDVFKGHPSEFAATCLYLIVLALAPVYWLRGDMGALQISFLTIPPLTLITLIGGRRNL